MYDVQIEITHTATATADWKYLKIIIVFNTKLPLKHFAIVMYHELGGQNGRVLRLIDRFWKISEVCSPKFFPW
jgi:hypothetical protein